MFTSLSIRNFRCFDSLSIDDSLVRVNLIAGLNSAGKTALLEAIYLLIGMGNAALIQRLSVFRKVTDSFSGGPQQFSEIFWDPLFYNLDSSKDIEIKGLHSEGQHVVRLSIDRTRTKQVSVLLGGEKGDSDRLDPVPVEGDVLNSDALIYEHTKPDQSIIKTQSMLAGRDGSVTSIHVSPASPEPIRGSFYAANQPGGPQEDAARYTRLESGREPIDLLDSLRIMEPRLERVRVGVVAGTPMLRGDIGIDRMAPLSLLGEGLVRLTGILLSIADAPDGVVLIDEIENGFHHSVLSRVWAAIGEAARRYNTQVFATTHSFECIEAAHEAFREDKEYAFRLHRLERIADETHVITYDQGTLAAALRSNLEVR